MALVRLPKELLLDILDYKDLSLQDRLSLRLVHPVLTDLLHQTTIEAVRITICGDPSKDDKNLWGFIEDPYLAEMRGSVRTLKIWIECIPGYNRLFRTAPTKEEVAELNKNELDLAISVTADATMQGALGELLSSLPKLQKLQVRAWCGRGSREVAKAVLRGLGQHVPMQPNPPELSVFLYGLGTEVGQRRNVAVFQDIPDTVDNLELRGCCTEWPQGDLLEEGIALVLPRCHSLKKFTVRMAGRNGRAPTLLEVLDCACTAMTGTRYLPLRHLEANLNAMYPWHRTEPIYSIDAVEEDTIKLPNLKSLELRGRPTFGDLDGSQEFWTAVPKAGIYLESVASKSIGDSGKSALFTYLASPQVSNIIKALDLSGFDWYTHEIITYSGWEEEFWGEVLPSICNSLEVLTLLMHGRNPKPRRLGNYTKLKILHGWSLSHRTLVQREKIRFKNLRKLETYAILDQEPESETTRWFPNRGRWVTSPYKYRDDSPVMTMNQIMDYLGEYCPKLTSINLYVLPGGPLRILGGMDDIKDDLGPEIRNHIEDMSKAICKINQNTSSSAFKLGTELALNFVGHRNGIVSTVNTSEYFYTPIGWNKRRSQETVRTSSNRESSLSELFPEDFQVN